MSLRAIRALPPLETAVVAVALVALIVVGVARQSATDAPAAVDSYSSYDAASGGYRAFAELLAREGVPFERFEQRPAFLDGALDTLVYADPSTFDVRQTVPTPADVAALEAWVRGGGRLLYVGYDDAAAKAGVLALPRTHLAGAASSPTKFGTRARAVATCSRRNAVAFIAPPLATLAIADVAVESSRRWIIPSGRTRALLADACGALVVTTPVGAGTVVGVVDRTLFTNAGIATADRARLALALARPRHRFGIVAFDEAIHGYTTPEHWWSIVPRRFAIALALALVALMIAFAGAAVRFGPPLARPARPEGTSFEFLDALASLFRRDGNVRETLRDAAHSATLAIRHALALGPSASNEEIESLIERDDLRAAFRAMSALTKRGFDDEASLVRGVAAAQRLRKEYAPHGRYRN